MLTIKIDQVEVRLIGVNDGELRYIGKNDHAGHSQPFEQVRILKIQYIA